MQVEFAKSEEVGQIDICHLKRFWSKSMQVRNGNVQEKELPKEWALDKSLMDVLNIGLEQTIRFVYVENPSFEAFENWILEKNGGAIEQEKIVTFNRQFDQSTTSAPRSSVAASEQVLSPADLDFWATNGYVVIPNAVPLEQCEAVESAIWTCLEMEKSDPQSWYKTSDKQQGIMVQLFQHPAIEKNRKSERIKKAFAQLWETDDLIVSADRVSFNPPETANYHFPGPYLHWDVRPQPPIPFGLQGLLYLTDTAANQGAFTLVPGFHRKIDDWVQSLPPGASASRQDLDALGPQPIAGKAGDFIIWHQALPHGSRPNTASLPRMVQYIKWYPLSVAT